MDGRHDLWIKMDLFRNQFQLTAKEIAGLKHFTTFSESCKVLQASDLYIKL